MENIYRTRLCFTTNFTPHKKMKLSSTMWEMWHFITRPLDITIKFIFENETKCKNVILTDYLCLKIKWKFDIWPIVKAVFNKLTDESTNNGRKHQTQNFIRDAIRTITNTQRNSIFLLIFYLVFTNWLYIYYLEISFQAILFRSLKHYDNNF